MKNIPVVFEDDDILAINKPAGLLTLPDRYNSSLPSVKSLLGQVYSSLHIVHRLDVGTSGLLLLAKNAAAHKIISTEFAERRVVKKYLALVKGLARPQTIDIPLMQAANGRVVPSARGKQSLTKLEVIETFRNASLISAELITGRTHQIRAHLAAIGTPLLVDETYGEQSAFYLSSIKRRFNMKKGESERPIISRPTLHSYSGAFTFVEKKIDLCAEPPNDFSALVNVLQKYAKISSY